MSSPHPYIVIIYVITGTDSSLNSSQLYYNSKKSMLVQLLSHFPDILGSKETLSKCTHVYNDISIYHHEYTLRCFQLSNKSSFFLGIFVFSERKIMFTWLIFVALASTTWAAPPLILQGFTAMNSTVTSHTLQTKQTLHTL